VSAKFKGKLTLSDVKPPDSYSISFEGQGGPAGFAKGGAQVRLSPENESTRLAYDVKANVGGKLAQIGSRLVDAAAKKVADDFFRNFNEKVGELHKKKVTTHEHEEHAYEDRPAVERDPELPTISDTTLMFFAGGALVLTLVALMVLLD
jgi:hypothetical protein